VSHRWKIVIIVAAVAAILSTPLVWLLGSTDAAQLAGASVQAATGVGALLWALLSGPASPAPVHDEARHTGRAEAVDGGRAVTGVKRPGGRGSGSATAENTGPSTARGPDSTATSGIDYT
jgi:hypothetical protein